MAHPLADEGLELAAQPPAILLLGGGHAHHGADPRLATLVGQQGAHERLAVDPVGLGAPPASRGGDRGGIDDVALDAFLLERAVQPEAVQAGLLDGHERKDRAGARQGPVPKSREALEQTDEVATAHAVARHLLARPRRERGDQPGCAAELKGDEDRPEVGADRHGRAGKFSSRGHGHLQRAMERPVCSRSRRSPAPHGILT